MEREQIIMDTDVGVQNYNIYEQLLTSVVQRANSKEYLQSAANAAYKADKNDNSKLDNASEHQEYMKNVLNADDLLTQQAVRSIGTACEHVSPDSPDAAKIIGLSDITSTMIALNKAIANGAQNDSLSEKQLSEYTPTLQTIFNIPQKADFKKMGMTEADAEEVTSMVNEHIKTYFQNTLQQYQQHPDLASSVLNMPDGSELKPLSFDQICEAATGKPSGKSI